MLLGRVGRSADRLDHRPTDHLNPRYVEDRVEDRAERVSIDFDRVGVRGNPSCSIPFGHGFFQRNRCGMDPQLPPKSDAEILSALLAGLMPPNSAPFTVAVTVPKMTQRGVPELFLRSSSAAAGKPVFCRSTEFIGGCV